MALPKVVWICPNGYEGHSSHLQTYEATRTRRHSLCDDPLKQCFNANRCLVERYVIAGTVKGKSIRE